MPADERLTAHVINVESKIDEMGIAEDVWLDRLRVRWQRAVWYLGWARVVRKGKPRLRRIMVSDWSPGVGIRRKPLAVADAGLQKKFLPLLPQLVEAARGR